MRNIQYVNDPLRLKGFTWVAGFATGTYTIGTEGNRMAYSFCFESSLFETQIVFDEHCPKLRKKCLFFGVNCGLIFVKCVLSVVMCVLHFEECDLYFVKI
jgi:hypothetical protein